MKYGSWILVLMLIGCVYCTGCMNGQKDTREETVPIVAVTSTPTPATPFPTAIPRQVAVTIQKTQSIPEGEPTLEAIEPEWTEEPVVYPTAVMDTSRTNFTQFKNRDFMAEYPSSWTVENETFPVRDVTRYKQDMYQKEGRSVIFYSEDRQVSMMVTVYDFIAPGRYTYNPTIDSARRSVQTLFPNASGDSSVYSYEYRKNEQGIITSKYDVYFAPDVEYYPYSYTEETWVTYNHLFNVDFIVRTGNLGDYKELKYKMMKSIVTEGMQNNEWWL